MPLTVSLTGDWLESVGSKRAVNGKITFDSSYPTGGESLTPANIGLGVIDNIDFSQGVGGLVFRYDYANKKVMAFYPTGGSAAPAALADPVTSVPSGATTVTSTAAQPDLTETAGRGKEVAASTDLSSIAVEFRATGR
jgi:hypothetical protein